MSNFNFEKGKMVPVPSHSIIPERDLGKTPVLECSHLGIDFGGLRAVDDFNFTIGKTEIAGLIGPNGAGKTTVFNLLTKVYTPTRGIIMLNGMDTSGKTTVQINKMGIARTFQNIRLFSNLTVEDNVKIGLHNSMKYSSIEGILRLPSYWKAEKAAHERAMELLSIFNMEDKADWRAGNLPYGAQRRLEIVRALATNPCLLLLDEPVTGLDPVATNEMYNLIKLINLCDSTSVIMVSHDIHAAVRYATHILHLGHSQLFFGTTAQYRESDLARRFVGGSRA